MLKISVSGIRGIWGDSLNHATIVKVVETFIAFKGSNKKIAISTDTRSTGTAFKYLVSSILLSYGYNIIDLGVTASPLIVFAIKHMGLDAGIMLSASHNEAEWNAFKFVQDTGVFFNQKEMKKIEELFHSSIKIPYNYKTIGSIQSYNYLLPYYFDVVAPFFIIEQIRKRKFKIVADAGNGVASLFLPHIFEFLNIEGTIIYKDLGHHFERAPEPIPANLHQLQEAVLNHQPDLGIAFDPDGDRLGLVDEKGRALEPHWSLLIAYLDYLETKKNANLNIVVNFSTTMLVKEIAKKYNGKVFQAPVGEMNVINSMHEHNVEIGGEGNGGVIFPAINECRDAIIGLFFILEYLTLSKKKLSDIVDSFSIPEFINEQLNAIKVLDLPALEKELTLILENLEYSKWTIDLSDGLYCSYGAGWIQVRASNTENIIRIMGESYDTEKQLLLFQSIKKNLSHI